MREFSSLDFFLIVEKMLESEENKFFEFLFCLHISINSINFKTIYSNAFISVSFLLSEVLICVILRDRCLDRGAFVVLLLVSNVSVIDSLISTS